MQSLQNTWKQSTDLGSISVSVHKQHCSSFLRFPSWESIAISLIFKQITLQFCTREALVTGVIEYFQSILLKFPCYSLDMKVPVIYLSAYITSYRILIFLFENKSLLLKFYTFLNHSELFASFLFDYYLYINALLWFFCNKRVQLRHDTMPCDTPVALLLKRSSWTFQKHFDDIRGKYEDIRFFIRIHSLI